MLLSRVYPGAISTGGSAMDYESAVEIREAMREQTHVLRELCEAVLTLAAAVASPRCERPSEAVDLVRWVDGVRRDGEA